MLSNKTLIWLSEKQKELDQDILDHHHLENNEEIFKKKTVAFFVELGEYANETRAFKFWSNKKPSELDVCLEEYIDGVHFIISLGNYIEYDFDSFKFMPKDIDEVNNYLDIINTLANFSQNPKTDNYTQFLNSFLNIMNINHYSEKQVIDMYKKKNKINWERQENNY